MALSWVWELPGLSGLTGLRRTMLAGWSVNGIATFYAGQPLRIRSDRDNDFDSYQNGDRPDVVGDWKLSPNRSRDEVIQRWFDPRAFAPNRSGQLGNLGRNVVSGPGFKGVDLGVSKNFRITERHQVQFPTDVEVFFVAPPALDEFRRWVTEWVAQQQAAEEAAERAEATGEQG